MLLLLAIAPGGCGIPSASDLRIGGAARPEYLPSPLPLGEKASRFEELARRHIAPEGVNIYILHGEETAEEAIAGTRLADCAIWTGVLLGAEVLRHAETGDPDAGVRSRLLLRGLEALQEITGIRGYFARCLARRTAPIPAETGTWHPGSGAWSAYRWKGDTSKDQYAGIIFGLGLAATLSPDGDLRKAAAGDLRAVADLLIQNGYRIRGPGGKTTTHGDLRGWLLGVPIGVNALISLAAVKCAAEATGDPRYAGAYRALVREGYDRAAYWAKFQILGRTNGNNDVMAVLSLFNLLRLERDPVVRDRYVRSCRRLRGYVRHDGNALFNFILAWALGGDRDLVEDGLLTLRLFPLEKRTLPVDLRGDPRFEERFWRGKAGTPLAARPLPVNYRAQSTWVWRDDPRALVSGPGRGDRDERCAPTDYLAAYWIGRHLRWIGPDDENEGRNK